jgi:hypothetical protein
MIYTYDSWNKWSVKSINTPFKSTEKAIGDGELKLGTEFGVIPLGQNFTYDLDINDERWEVKKLDSDNSFRLGVEIATHYTPLISSIIRILESILLIKNDIIESRSGILIRNCIQKIENTSGRTSTLLLDGLRKNEVSESNLSKANEIIEILKSILFEHGTMNLFSSIDGLKYDYNILDAFRKIILEKISVDIKVKIIGDIEIYNRLLITNQIYQDICIFSNISFIEKLNEIIREVFKNVTLVLVHEKKGFKPIRDLHSIYCNRITSGLPRCKLV